MGCLAGAVHGWFVGKFVCAMVYVVRGDAWPLLLSPCNTYHMCHKEYGIFSLPTSAIRLARRSMHLRGKGRQMVKSNW